LPQALVLWDVLWDSLRRIIAGDRMTESRQNERDSSRREKNLALPMKSWNPVRRFSGSTRNRGGIVLGVATVALMSCSNAAALKQDPLPQLSDVATVQGTIRDTDGMPVALATVCLEEKGNSKKVETKTNAAGAFVLSAGHAGTYTVRAQKAGWSDAVKESLVLSIGDRKHVDLVLPGMNPDSSRSQPPAKPSPGAMEFKDEPNFTVAGVTDWSNLGLHGSAASSRTSESLAKETLGLKSGEPERASASVSEKRYEVALAYRDKGDFTGAREQVRKALSSGDDAEGHRLLGELGERLNEPLEAVREYELAARMDPSEQNYFEWGKELLLHKAAEPAAEIFARGSNAHPKSARMLTGLGAALYSSGSLEEAARRLCEASDLEPADPAPYLFLGEIEKSTPAPLPCSEQKLARFAQQQPGNALASFYYAISLWKREKGSENSEGFEQVEALLEKSLAIDPKLDQAYLQLGALHFARGDFKQAIGDYKKAIDVNPQLGEAHRQLGLAFQRMGQKEQAGQEFQAYEQIEKAEAAEIERQRRELRQFLIVLKDHPQATPPH
jgi:tetratricopeptide (TPR) repeat protein